MTQMITNKVLRLTILPLFLPKLCLVLLPLVIPQFNLFLMFFMSFLIFLLLLSFFRPTLNFTLNLNNQICLLLYSFRSQFLQLLKLLILLSPLLLKCLLFRLILWLSYLQKFIWNILFINLTSLSFLIFILILILSQSFLIFSNQFWLIFHILTLLNLIIYWNQFYFS